MNNALFAFDMICLQGESATHPLIRQAVRLPLSRLLAGTSLPRRCFAAATHPDAPSGASNYGI